MFKEKTSKKRLHINDSTKDTSTLDARHQSMIQNLQDNKDSIKDFHVDLYKINQKIIASDNLIKEFKEKGDVESNSYNLEWSKNLEYNEIKKELQRQIGRLESFQDEINYYENTGNILFQYYDIIDRQNSENQHVSVPPAKVIKSRKKQQIPQSMSILDAFKMNSEENVATSVKDDGEPLVDKATLVADYLAHMDSMHLAPINHDSIGFCPRCTVMLICIQQEGVMVCPDCGYQESLLIEQNRPLLRQPNKEASHFSYKRINHFREWCSQVQGKESTDIPEEIFEQILQEIKKEKIYDTRKITYSKMREILKKLKINKYYEHINYIINRINGVPTPHFSPELEDKLCSMFKEIQGPFLKHCPKDRKNFLSYSYVLYKLFQILGKNEYLRFFQLLKSREKLSVQDQIFRKICEDLNWPFYPSL